MYAREIGGTVHTFGVSGKLIMNTLVMYDHQTESLWAQLLGRAVAGGLEGTALELLPSTHTTWEVWRALHPDSLVLDKMGGFRSDPYESYYRSPALGTLGETFGDDRLFAKEFVVGVVVGDEPVAYPFSRLNETPVVNDEVAGEPLLVVFSADSATAAVWSRRLGDKTLTFRPVEGTDLEVEDDETRTRWRRIDGLAIAGPLAGKSLTLLPSTYAFWFGWKDWYPDTAIYGLASGS